MESSTQKARGYAPISAEVERVGKIVLDAAYRVHTALGPGLLESVCETCHAYEIRESGLLVETQVAVPVTYKKMRLEGGLRLDLLVEKCVIIEIKAVEIMNPIYEAQTPDLSATYRFSSRLSHQLQRPASQERHQANGCIRPSCPFVTLSVLCV
jgi:GxxExxY protein